MTQSGDSDREAAADTPSGGCAEKGFGLVELLIAGLIFVMISMSIFEVLANMQRTAANQPEIQGVLENTRIAIDSVQRILLQAGNDPFGIGFAGIVINSATEVRVRSDLTGSAGPAMADKGDPDGDLEDSGEDVTIRYNAGSHSIELVSPDGGAQPIAGNISDFRLQFFDGNGLVTGNGRDVFRIRISITGTSPVRDPQTGIPFSIELNSEIQLAVRQ
jgi:type II secretory pathway pseudopilin PulG